MTIMSERDEIKSIIPPASEAEGLPARVKFQATIGIECAIFPLFIIGILVFMAVVFLSGGKHGNGLIQSESGLLIGLGIGGAFWLVALLIWILVDDFYILDRSAHRILLHKGFRCFGMETPFLEGSQIIAVGLNCSELRYKGGQYGWRYAPVLLVKNREAIELSTMDSNVECDKLGDYNRKTRSWAAALGCQWIECPARQVFQVQDYFDANRNEFNSISN